MPNIQRLRNISDHKPTRASVKTARNLCRVPYDKNAKYKQDFT